MLPLLSLVLGLSAAMAAREQILRDGSVFRGVHLIGVLLTCTAVLVPLGAYLFLLHPTWSMLYWLEPLDISNWHILFVALGTPVAGAIGYLTGALLCRRAGSRATLAASGAGLAGLVVCLALVGDRMLHLTDEIAWQDAPSLLSGDLTAVFAFALPVVLAAWVFLVLLYEVEGRKLQRASGVRLAAGAALQAAQQGPGPGESLASLSESPLAIPDLRSSAEMSSGQGPDAPEGSPKDRGDRAESDGDRKAPAGPSEASGESSAADADSPPKAT